MNKYLLSASHGMQLLSFPDLKPILNFNYDKIDDGANMGLDEFGNGLFLKSSYSQFKLIGLIEDESKIGNFKTIQEFQISNAVCSACPKSEKSPLMAIGLADGTITLAHHETQQQIATLQPKSKLFNDDVSNCLKYLDFNFDHSQLVSIVEEDCINVFDINRKKLAFEIKEFQNDEPTLAKYKPNSDPNTICIGFTSGKLKLFDTRTQKVVYKSKNKHFNMCKDLCFFNTKQSCVISVGYDSSVLIHDFRVNSIPSISFVSDHHLNTITISADDNYYCIGDYKGNLNVYDMRKSKSTLSKTKIGNEIVKKIIFVQSAATEFYDNSTKGIIDQNKTKLNSTLLEYDSFFNFDVPKLEVPSPRSPSVNCKNIVNDGHLDDLNCENQFIQNIKSRSTCLFEQPHPNSIKSHSPTVIDDNNVPNTSNSQATDIITKIDSYENQLKEMKSEIQGLKSMVAEMTQFIEMFPEFLQLEISNLKRKYKEEDMMLVAKLSIMCASNPQIVELTNYVLKRHSSSHK